MLKKIGYSLASLAIIGSVAAFAANKQQSPLNTDMKAFVVTVDAKGKEKLHAAKRAEPGQVIQYQITSTNAGKQKLSGLMAVGPIPAHTHYVGRSAHTKIKSAMQVSIDGGKVFEDEPVKRKQTMKDGSVKMVVVPADKYTHIRWKAQDALASGKKHVYNYRVKVN
jgi:uncharacterized repeat protein (TIGR01451 family)